jgi:hypothetical protein
VKLNTHCCICSHFLIVPHLASSPPPPPVLHAACCMLHRFARMRTMSSRSKARSCTPTCMPAVLALHCIRQAPHCGMDLFTALAPRASLSFSLILPLPACLPICACALCTVQKLARLLAFALQYPAAARWSRLRLPFFLAAGGGRWWRRERASRRRWRSRAAQRGQGQPKGDWAPWARRPPAEEESHRRGRWCRWWWWRISSHVKA